VAPLAIESESDEGEMAEKEEGEESQLEGFLEALAMQADMQHRQSMVLGKELKREREGEEGGVKGGREGKREVLTIGRGNEVHDGEGQNDHTRRM